MNRFAKQATALGGASCSEKVGVLPTWRRTSCQSGQAHSVRRLEYRTQVARGQKKAAQLLWRLILTIASMQTNRKRFGGPKHACATALVLPLARPCAADPQRAGYPVGLGRRLYGGDAGKANY